MRFGGKAGSKRDGRISEINRPSLWNTRSIIWVHSCFLALRYRVSVRVHAVGDLENARRVLATSTSLRSLVDSRCGGTP